jgi:hypothetical protein
MGGKETAMLELTEAQVQALEAQKAPLQLVNPATQEVFVLIRKDVYDLTCGIVGGGRRGAWADEDDDLIRKRSWIGSSPLTSRASLSGILG